MKNIIISVKNIERKFQLTLALALTCSLLLAQNGSQLNGVLNSIETNNTTLTALRKAAEAQKLENKTDIFLPNPEVGLNYLWSDPSSIGSRTDVSVVQSFDIPTIAGMKKQMANEQNNLVEWQYKANRMNILLEANQYCIDLIYNNALKKELELRMEHAETIADGYKTRLAQGDANILEYNKVQLNLYTIQGEISQIEVERNALLSQLKRMNGGIDVAFDDFRYNLSPLPENFDEWVAQASQRNPALAYLEQEIEVGKKQVSINKAMGLPTFSAGYMSEKVVGQQYQGVAMGVSIPIWENKNRVKQAKASVIASEALYADNRQQIYSQLQILYDRAAGLKTIAANYRSALVNINNADLLKKALDMGEISLLEYIVEIGLYYNSINLALEAERDYQKAFAELSAVEL